MSDFSTDLARSIGFLSRYTVPSRYFEGDDGSFSRMVRAFPMAGALILLPPALVFAALLALHLEAAVAALLLLALQTAATGALHEDGLSDTADGIGGGADREKALAIMRDSRIGSYGAAALILSYGLRASAIAAIATVLPPLGAATMVVAVASVSRAAMVWHWSALPPARRDGVAVAVGIPSPAAMRVALGSAAAIALLLVWPVAGFAAAVAMLAAAGLAAWALTRYIGRRLGGHTGDTIGACQQCAEIAGLAALALLT